ncbi:DUF2092 domain-containing protein [Rhodoplanes roseus]|uniref:DUF2092 domain-containing protein n=1 Tax=Rhodoplanes roseus TaxID=29409 RepID=A0A327L7M9_9BRAD|nr:DUF2092 domain-containing protein [Rhodoplanes roseus]RAI45512.1 hypothetical protein CH341_03755 [Rhodoplanes roseus]
MIQTVRRLVPKLTAVAATLLMMGAAGPTEAAPRGKDGPRPNPVDPAVVAAFDRMGAYVAGLAGFELATTYAFDVVARNGQTVTVDGAGQYLVRRPDRLAATVTNDLFARTYVYDGKTLVIASPSERYYARVPARPTIRDMLAGAAAEHAIEIPAADLFDLGTPNAPTKGITSAFRVGTATIAGEAAEHFAFRSKDRDWEVWIRAGDKPVPLRFTLIDRAQPAAPRYTVTLGWTERTDIPDTAFVFSPRPDQTPVAILRLGRKQGSN